MNALTLKPQQKEYNDGNVGYDSRTKTKRVVSKVASKIFNYYSANDVSGLIRINLDQSWINNKYYIKLEYLIDFKFKDSISYINYRKYKNDFYDTYRIYNVYMDFNQNKDIARLTKYDIFNIFDNNPCGCLFFLFIRFTLWNASNI